jgi:hypothetical protein
MNSGTSSIHDGITHQRRDVPLVWQSRDGQIHVQAEIKSKPESDNTLIANTHFQGGRARLLTAVSLASLMGAPPSAQESQQMPPNHLSRGGARG